MTYKFPYDIFIIYQGFYEFLFGFDLVTDILFYDGQRFSQQPNRDSVSEIPTQDLYKNK